MTPSLLQSDRGVLRDLVLLTLIIGLFFSIQLGSRPLSVPDEARYVEIPREMAATGDYVTPRLNGVKYFEKPVLFYWLEALSIRLFGIRELTLRLWPALFGLAGCLAVYGAGRRLYGRTAGILAALILATSALYYGLSRAIILDMPVSVLLSAALLCFLAGTREPAGSARRLYFWGFYAFSALAMLTKGLIGVFIPAMIIGAWILVLNDWRLLKSMYLPSGLLVFLLIAAPWHVLVHRANPEFSHFYFVHEHFQRYLTKVHNRYEPFWFFLPVLLVGLFPWSSFLFQALRSGMRWKWRERLEHRDALFLVLWAGLVLLFFSASDSKLPPYILPVLPPVALLIGRYLAPACEGRDVPGVRTGLGIATGSMVLLGAVLAVAPRFLPLAKAAHLGRSIPMMAGTLVAGAGAVWIALRLKGFRWAFAMLLLSTAVFLTSLNGPAALLEVQSAKPLIDMVKSRIRPGDEVVSYCTYYQDLPVYLERRITVANWKGELEFGMSVEDTSSWMVDNDAFWKIWNGPNRVYLFTKREIYDRMPLFGFRQYHFVAGTQETVLVTNKEMEP